MKKSGSQRDEVTCLESNFTAQLNIHIKSDFVLTKKNMIEKPTQSDILCGRGRQVYSHDGNTRFEEIVEKYKYEYQTLSSSNSQKAHIASKVISEVRKLKPPGRFLELEPTSKLFVEIGNVRAARKVKIALRMKCMLKEIESDPSLDLKPQQKIIISNNFESKVSKDQCSTKCNKKRKVGFCGSVFASEKPEQRNRTREKNHIAEEFSNTNSYIVESVTEGRHNSAIDRNGNDMKQEDRLKAYEVESNLRSCVKMDTSRSEYLTKLRHGDTLNKSTKKNKFISYDSNSMKKERKRKLDKISERCNQTTELAISKRRREVPQLTSSEIKAIYWAFKASVPWVFGCNHKIDIRNVSLKHRQTVKAATI